MERLHGVLTALVTPFTGGEVDYDTFRALCRRQLEAGVAGLVPCGTTGEAPTLDDDEWSKVVAAAIREAHGRVPVVAGCGSNSTAGTVRAIEKAQSLGADAALVVLPYYNKPNPPGLAAHVQACCRPGLPVVLYYVPGRTAQTLPVRQLAQLCETPGVAAVKDATGDVRYGQELLGLTSVAVLSGDDFTFAALVAMGGHGVISVVSNVAPKMTVEWCLAASRGKVRRLRELRAKLLPVVGFLFAETNPVPVKMAMGAMGLCSTELRLPLAPGTSPPPGLLEKLA